MSSHANIHAVRSTLSVIESVLHYISLRFSVPAINSNFVKMLVGYSIDRNEEVNPIMVFCYVMGRSHMEWGEFIIHWNSLTKEQKKPYRKLSRQYYDYIERDEIIDYKDPDSDYDDDKLLPATKKLINE